MHLMYFGTFIKKVRSAFSANKIIVLMYHRVVNKIGDPWHLAVSPANFDLHLAMLKKNFTIISVNELILQIHEKRIKKNCICLTFDDAYTDNFLYAQPLLEKYNCPATFFVPTNYINSKKPFWWDVLEELILHSPNLPLFLSLSIKGKLYTFNLKKQTLNKEEFTAQSSWTYKDKPPTERCILFLEVCSLFRPFSDSEVDFYLQQLKEWAGFQNKQVCDTAMSFVQLTQLSNNPLFSLGVHTCTHLDLNCHTNSEQQLQIIDCAKHLKFQYKNFVNAIAYPFGSYNKFTLAIVNQQGISVGFTTNSGFVNKHSKSHELDRFEVCDISGEKLLSQLRAILQ